MPFKYSCFISYRHGQNGLVKRFIDDLNDALSGELELYFGQGSVYLDREYLKGGAYLEKQLAQALCESVCLIAIYTPSYLQSDHPFCARELLAMELLEKKRFQALQHKADRANSLIIPIAFRGADEMHSKLKERIFYDFQDFNLTRRKMSKDHRYSAKIGQIAKYIRERCNQFRGLADDPCGDCEEFEIPSADSDEVKSLLHPSFPPYPLREGANQ